MYVCPYRGYLKWGGLTLALYFGEPGSSLSTVPLTWAVFVLAGQQYPPSPFSNQQYPPSPSEPASMAPFAPLS